MVKVEDDDDGLLMTPQLKEKLREKKKKKMGGDYSLDVEDPNELGIVYPTPRICDSSSAPQLPSQKKRDLIVDHKNDALSCKFNRSGSQVGLQVRKSAQRAAS